MRATYLGIVLLAIACGDQATHPADGGVDGVLPDGGGSQQTGCVTPTGPGTMHAGSLTRAETWTAAASPHYLPYDTTISAEITLEPCAMLLIGAAKTVTVRTGGRIVAAGTADKPVVIGPSESRNWASIRTMGGTLSFTYTGIFNGGDPLNSVPDVAGALEVTADQYMPPAEILHVDHVLIQDSASLGIFLKYRGAFSRTSRALTIKGSRNYPIHAWAVVAGTIPDGTYTGNAKDEILIDGESAYAPIDRDVTFHDRGVPYHIGSSLGFGQLRISGRPGPLATLTIEPNVTLRFKRGGILLVDIPDGSDPASGALVAAGTASQRITFTSAEPTPAAGDWLGIYFKETPNARSRLDFVDVDYAGGSSSHGGSSCSYPAPTNNDAAVRIFGTVTASIVTNTRIRNSAGHGIDRSWVGPPAPSFITGSNTFSMVRYCLESYPRPSPPSSCPAPAAVPCPR